MAYFVCISGIKLLLPFISLIKNPGNNNPYFLEIIYGLDNCLVKQYA